MEQTLLITLDDILTYTNISGSIDVYKMNPHIYNAQVLYTEPILGSSLYEKLLTLINNDLIYANSNSNYLTLLQSYITPSLVFHTMELFIPLNAFQQFDGGQYQTLSTNATASILDEVEKISHKYKIIGMKYDDKLHKYLCENSNLFTEYENNTGLIEKQSVSNSIGWNLSTQYTKNKIRR